MTAAPSREGGEAPKPIAFRIELGTESARDHLEALVAEAVKSVGNGDNPLSPEEIWEEELRWDQVEGHRNAALLPDREYFAGLSGGVAGMVRQVWRVNADAMERPSRFASLSMESLESMASEGKALSTLVVPLPVLDRAITDGCTTGRLSDVQRFERLAASWAQACVEYSLAIERQSRFRYSIRFDFETGALRAVRAEFAHSSSHWIIRDRSDTFVVAEGVVASLDKLMSEQTRISQLFVADLAQLAQEHCR